MLRNPMFEPFKTSCSLSLLLIYLISSDVIKGSVSACICFDDSGPLVGSHPLLCPCYVSDDHLATRH